MAKTSPILLLAGSAEAREIAPALRAKGHFVRALMSEPPRGSNAMPVPFEVLDGLDQNAMHAAMAGEVVVVDASHGFDGAMTKMGYAAAREQGVPFVSFQRPPWEVSGQGKWRSVADVGAGMALIAPGARVFSATGWASLPEYAAFPGACLMLRQTARHDRSPPFDFVELVFGDPPFTALSEQVLFQKYAVDTLMCRNLGGAPSRPKLDAALALDLDVILVERPALPNGVPVLHSVPAVLDWVAKQ